MGREPRATAHQILSHRYALKMENCQQNLLVNPTDDAMFPLKQEAHPLTTSSATVTPSAPAPEAHHCSLILFTQVKSPFDARIVFAGVSTRISTLVFTIHNGFTLVFRGVFTRSITRAYSRVFTRAFTKAWSFQKNTSKSINWHIHQSIH